MSATHAVGEVAARTGLDVGTLRYYGRHGVLPEPGRDAGGRRRYTEADVHLIEVLLHLRDTGMPLARIAEFTRLVADDPQGVPERLEILQVHHAQVLRRRRDLDASIAVIEGKIADYRHRLAAP